MKNSNKKRWLRIDLLKSSFLTGISGYLIPISISITSGYTMLGLWLAFRSILQLILVLIPNPGTLLLQTTIKTKRSISEEEKLEDGVFTFSITLSTLIMICVILIGRETNLNNTYVTYYLSLYAFLFTNSSIFSIIARVKKQSALILKVSYIDTIFTSSAAILGLISFDLLLGTLIIKEFFRITLFIRLIKIKFKIIRTGELFLKKRSSQYFRNILQVFSQYGDKAIMPIIFGLTTSGQIGLGNSIASVISILTSSAYMWSLPLILNSDKNIESWLKNEWFKAIIISIMASWLIFLPSSIYLSQEESIFITIGFITTSTISASFLYLTSSRENATKIKPIIIYGFILATYYIFIYLASFYTNNPEKSIISGFFLLILMLSLLTINLSKKLLLAYTISAINLVMILFINTKIHTQTI